MQPKSLTDLDTLLLQSQQWRKPDARTLEVFATQLARARAAIADDLAAANARAEAAEAKLAAVPVREIGRWYNNSSTHNAIEAGRYGYYDALGDSQVIKDWLGSQSEAGVLVLGLCCGGAIVGFALIAAAIWWLKDFQMWR
jgi:hypothetical protein